MSTKINKQRHLQAKLDEAMNIVLEIAAWSVNNPRGRIYPTHQSDKMDTELIQIENKAKALVELEDK